MKKMSEEIKISIPLKPDEINYAHKTISKLSEKSDVVRLELLSEYLYSKSNEIIEISANTNDQDLRRDAFLLEDLGKLALDIAIDFKLDLETDQI